VAIAADEHPNVDILSAKLILLSGEKVYKVSFADSWTIYVRASDGDIVVIKDWAQKLQPIHNYAKHNWVKKYGWWNPYSAGYYKGFVDGWKAANAKAIQNLQTSTDSTTTSSTTAQAATDDLHSDASITASKGTHSTSSASNYSKFYSSTHR